MATRTSTSYFFRPPRWGYYGRSGPSRYPSRAFPAGWIFTHLWICWPYRWCHEKKSAVVTPSGHRPRLTIIISSFEIQMFHMSDGSRYSNCGVMGFNYGSLMQFGLISLQLTECRISALVFPRAIPRRRKVYDLFIWDWRTGKKYLVSHTTLSLGTNQPHAFVKGALSNDYICSFYRRIPTRWHS